ncbi:FAS1-like dehydratase domain-containing protein [Halobacillus sp. H74]|uniref:FAS1-like dehydratase domain-containing protein n=1 Tax=Halobacillus sp. H74 TaxID=3457436 RepID=UPI003FCCBC05
MVEERWLNHTVEASAILVHPAEIGPFAEAVFLKNSIYFDFEAAKAHGYPHIPLPATMPITFWKKFDIPWLNGIEGVIHAEQRFEYKTTLVADREYQATLTLNRIEEKESSLGMMEFLYHTLDIYHLNELQCKVYTTLIVKGEELS